MNKILVIVASAVLAAVSASGQTAARPEAKAAGLGKATTASSADLNIRAYIELLRKDIRKEAAGIIGEVMQLDADQATKFWPVYKEFETEYQAIGDQIVAAVKQYSDNYTAMTPAVADDLANQVLTIEGQRNALKKKYYGRMKTAIDPITAARFLQVHNQLERVMDLQLAAQLPVIGAE